MKKLFTILAIAILGISCSNAQKTEFTKATLEAKMSSEDGSSVTFQEIISPLKGKTILIDVWASWCGDCIKGMPKLKELQKNNPDLVYVFVSMDKTPEAWKNGIAKHELVGKHYLAPDGMKGVFGKSVDLDWIPRYILVDKNGKIALYRAIHADDEKLLTTIKTIK